MPDILRRYGGVSLVDHLDDRKMPGKITLPWFRPLAALQDPNQNKGEERGKQMAKHLDQKCIARCFCKREVKFEVALQHGSNVASVNRSRHTLECRFHPGQIGFRFTGNLR